jgi:hypothetical protein
VKSEFLTLKGYYKKHNLPGTGKINLKQQELIYDYFLVSTEILMNSYSSDIRPIVLKFTDHNSISLKLKLFKGNKGNVYWKLNTSILENKEYCKSIEKCYLNKNSLIFLSRQESNQFLLETHLSERLFKSRLCLFLDI